MAFMAPILAQNRPFLLTGYWSHQVLNKDAAQRWRSFAGIKSVLIEHGLEQLSEYVGFVFYCCCRQQTTNCSIRVVGIPGTAQQLAAYCAGRMR